MIRRRIRTRLLDRIVAGAQPVDGRWLDRATLVLAPHPDDETLGCGGLVATLRRRQIPVHIVVMTDGAASHGHADVELTALRRREGVEAAATLGVGAADLTFLDHPDGSLTECRSAAIDDVATLIGELDPGQLVVPHWAEPNRDHAASFDIADAAVRSCAPPTEALVTPVWLWDQFPWVAPSSHPRGRHGRRASLDLAVSSRFGLGLRRWLTHRLHLDEDTLGIKRNALEHHESQMTRPPGRPDWPILADVADGEWLELLLGHEELYGTTVLGRPAGPDAGSR